MNTYEVYLNNGLSVIVEAKSLTEDDRAVRFYDGADTTSQLVASFTSYIGWRLR